jgi:gluconate 5-dehydrogenase
MVGSHVDLFSLAGRTVLITGAAGFLGRTMSEAVLAAGARLVALGRSDRLRTEATAWAARYGADRIHFGQVDMYDFTELEDTLKRIALKETVDVLINNAHELNASTGFNVEEGRLESATFDSWMRNLTAGAYWPAMTTRIFGDGMKERGGGSIVNIASIYGVVAPSPKLYEGTSFINPPGYSASKAAMLALTRYTASFWGAHGIRANAIVAGPFSNTDEVGPNSVDPNDPFLQRLRDRTCLGRTGRPAELVGPLLFLASPASSFVTGHALAVDGGWTII